MLHLLKRHPIPIIAHFDWCLVLTYALPADRLTPLLPPGLTLDTHCGYGFIACALVQTRGLRPAIAPAFLGQSFFLVGFRIFARFKRPDGVTLRGLKILRSLTDKPLMVHSGNLLTHYNYARAQTHINKTSADLSIQTACPRLGITLDISANLAGTAASLPEGSIFQTPQEARRFQGPMPFTFDHEPQTNSTIIIKGMRQSWHPRMVDAKVRQNTFFDSLNLSAASPVLSSVFYIEDINYRWEVGVRHPLTSACLGTSDEQRVIDDE